MLGGKSELLCISTHLLPSQGTGTGWRGLAPLYLLTVSLGAGFVSDTHSPPCPLVSISLEAATRCFCSVSINNGQPAGRADRESRFPFLTEWGQCVFPVTENKAADGVFQPQWWIRGEAVVALLRALCTRLAAELCLCCRDSISSLGLPVPSFSPCRTDCFPCPSQLEHKHSRLRGPFNMKKRHKISSRFWGGYEGKQLTG